MIPYMGLDVRKLVFGGLQTTKAQTSLCGYPRRLISAFLFAFWNVLYLNLYWWNFNFLASLCSWGDWFECRLVGNPQDRFGPFNYEIQHRNHMGISKVIHLSRDRAKLYIRPTTIIRTIASEKEPYHIKISKAVTLTTPLHEDGAKTTFVHHSEILMKSLSEWTWQVRMSTIKSVTLRWPWPQGHTPG